MFTAAEVKEASDRYETIVFESILPHLGPLKELSRSFHGEPGSRPCFVVLDEFFGNEPEIHMVTSGIEASINTVSKHFNIPVWYLKHCCRALHSFMASDGFKPSIH